MESSLLRFANAPWRHGNAHRLLIGSIPLGYQLRPVSVDNHCSRISSSASSAIFGFVAETRPKLCLWVSRADPGPSPAEPGLGRPGSSRRQGKREHPKIAEHERGIYSKYERLTRVTSARTVQLSCCLIEEEENNEAKAFQVLQFRLLLHALSKCAAGCCVCCLSTERCVRKDGQKWTDRLPG